MTRLVSLVVALVIAGAPVAIEACQIACESSTAATAHHSHQHGDRHATAVVHDSCHDTETPSSQLVPAPAPCDHHGEATAPSLAASRTSDMLISVPAVPSIDGAVVVDAATVVRAHQPPAGDRLEIRLARPLRR